MAAKNPRPSARPLRARAPRRSALRRFWLPAVLLLALAAGGLTGIVLAYELNYSKAAGEVASLATYRSSQGKRVSADRWHTATGQFDLRRGSPSMNKDIPPVLKTAILAVEDARLYDRIGLDPTR